MKGGKWMTAERAQSPIEPEYKTQIQSTRTTRRIEKLNQNLYGKKNN